MKRQIRHFIGSSSHWGTVEALTIGRCEVNGHSEVDLSSRAQEKGVTK